MSHEHRVALIHLGPRTGSARQIKEQLAQAGLGITEVTIESEKDFPQLQKALVQQVAILNLGNYDFDETPVIDQTSTAYGDRLVINDALIVDKLSGWERKRWLRHLLHKIDPAFSVLPDAGMPTVMTQPRHLSGIESVWVLAGSIGGPEAISAFLRALPADLPALFILAQHMGGDFQPMLRDQLAAVTTMPVELAWQGLPVQPASLILAPPRERMQVDEKGRLDLQPIEIESPLSPSIDAVCEMAVASFTPVNLAVFSGMSTDGVIGARKISQQGGQVIVQAPESTVIDSIIQGIKSRLQPDFEGLPEAMADYVKQSFVN
jgi:chemotaxis response regulator CheB